MNIRDKIFGGKLLDVEFIILTTIQEIMLSPLKIAELGDATKANAVKEGLVTNLDSFFSRILFAEMGKDTTEYKTARDKIIAKWRESIGRGNSPPMEIIDDLFKLTVETMAKERLFKTRRYVYFAYHWKQGQMLDLERLEQEDAMLQEGEGADED